MDNNKKIKDSELKKMKEQALDYMKDAKESYKRIFDKYLEEKVSDDMLLKELKEAKEKLELYIEAVTYCITEDILNEAYTATNEYLWTSEHKTFFNSLIDKPIKMAKETIKKLKEKLNTCKSLIDKKIEEEKESKKSSAFLEIKAKDKKEYCAFLASKLVDKAFEKTIIKK